jgi:hypothetical protein
LTILLLLLLLLLVLGPPATATAAAGVGSGPALRAMNGIKKTFVMNMIATNQADCKQKGKHSAAT